MVVLKKKDFMLKDAGPRTKMKSYDRLCKKWVEKIGKKLVKWHLVVFVVMSSACIGGKKFFVLVSTKGHGPRRKMPRNSAGS